MPSEPEQTGGTDLLVGVDVGGTFTDLVCLDRRTGKLCVVKAPSTPPDFHRAVIDAVTRVVGDGQSADVIHGSTVATNALLQRAGEPIAFVTTEGFRDMLLIGRQNRPQLYALHVRRPPPITPPQNWFTVRERVDARGQVVTPLTDAEITRVADAIVANNLKHVAICLLFSFANADHENRLAAACESRGLTVSLSSELLPEFREYERASTVTINASLRPTVRDYLASLDQGLSAGVKSLRIMQSAGGTVNATEAARSAAKLVLSGPAGGVTGAALVAKLAGFGDVITYDMGGTSTDVATIRSGRPAWTTGSTIDGLPIGLPTLDIHSVGAGGGSIAMLDVGGSLRVGPASAGARPGPACYGRGGTLPTVTDANLLLGRIQPDEFLGGAMRVDRSLAERAMTPLATAMGKSLIDAALGVVRIAESNMSRAIAAVTSRRGLDPRDFALVSFGGAGGLHACALAESLDIATVIVPPYCGVLSALGMVAAKPMTDVSRTVVHLAAELDDARLSKEFDELRDLLPPLPLREGRGEGLRSRDTSQPLTLTLSQGERGQDEEFFVDVRYAGQSYELQVRVDRPTLAEITREFESAYRSRYGSPPTNREIEIVTLRLRRTTKAIDVQLPAIEPATTSPRSIQLVDSHGQLQSALAMRRGELLAAGTVAGPMLLIDPEATAYVPADWQASARNDGTVILERKS